MEVSVPPRSRPTGVTVLALVLGWLGIGGFGNALVWSVTPAAKQLGTLTKVGSLGIGTPTFTVIAVLYGVFAFASAVGLWLMRSWTSRAYLAWSAVVLLLFAFYFWHGAGGFAPLAVDVGFFLLIALLLGAGYLYVRKHTDKVHAL